MRSLNFRSLKIIGLMASIFFHANIFAAQITLTNEDIVHGQILSMDRGILCVKNPIVCEMRIDCCGIADLQMDQVMDIILNDGRVFRGRISSGREKGKVIIIDVCDAETYHVDICSICSIKEPCNPCSGIPKAGKWQGTWSLKLCDFTGNTDKTDFHIEMKTKRPFKCCDFLHHQWELDGEYKYSEFDDKDNVSKGSAAARYERWWNTRLSWRAGEEFQFDQGKNLNSRWETSLGLGYYFIKMKRFSWQLRGGFSLVDAFYHGKKNEHDLHAPVGFAITWEVWKDAVASYELEYSPDVFDMDDVWVESDLRFGVPLKDHWELSIEYEIDYYSMPPPRKNKYDRELEVKLCYKF